MQHMQNRASIRETLFRPCQRSGLVFFFFFFGYQVQQTWSKINCKTRRKHAPRSMLHTRVQAAIYIIPAASPPRYNAWY